MGAPRIKWSPFSLCFLPLEFAMFRLHPFIALRPSSSELGFTLAEKMVIVAIIGIAAAVSAPSIMAAMNRAKVKQTMAKVQAALNETQREAIKGNKICTLTLNFDAGRISGSCLKVSDRSLDTSVAIVTNLIDPTANTAQDDESQPVWISSDVQAPSLGLNDGENISQIAMASSPEHKSQWTDAGMVVQVIAEKCKGNTDEGLGLGTCKDQLIPIKYGVLGNPEFAIISAQASPTDPSGKIIFFDPNNASGKKHCIAISNTLGLTRIGTYKGDIQPIAITDAGRCTAENWEDQ